ncbi:hypothetical protein MTO96_012677 [Rhipicephalus appendiculatus]
MVAWPASLTLPLPNYHTGARAALRSFLSRRGLYNHEQWHRREAALRARQNVAAGAQPTTSADGPPQQPDSDSDATPAESAGTTQPRQASPGPAAAPEPPLAWWLPSTPQLSGGEGSPGDSDYLQQASGSSTSSTATGRLSQEALFTPLPSGAGDLTEEPADQDQQQQASASPTSSAAVGPLSQEAGRTSSSSDEYASPAAQDSEELPGQTAGPAVGGQPSPDATTPRGGDQGNGSTYGTQEEAADSMGPESAWVLAEETAELRALRRLPVDDEQWARFETILDRTEAAIVEHLRLPNRGSRQTPPRREINPDNAAEIQALYRRNRRRAVRLIADGPSQLGPIDPGTLHDFYTRLWSPAAVDTTLLRCESTAPGRGPPDVPPLEAGGPGRAVPCGGILRLPPIPPHTPELEDDEDDPDTPEGRPRGPHKLAPHCPWSHDRQTVCRVSHHPAAAVVGRPCGTPGRRQNRRWGAVRGVPRLCQRLRLGRPSALVDAVRGAGAGEAFTATVEELYRANTTCVVAAAGTTEPINIGAGLRQGCPLSGLLFNMVVDPGIRAVQGGARQHNILAYADDLTLLAEDPATLQGRLNVVTALSDRLGLRLKPAQCRTLHLSWRHPVGTRPTTFTVGGDPVPALADFEGHRFLGRPVGFRVLPDQTTVDEAIHLGRRLLSSMLTPWQRLDAIKTFLYPALNFAMRVGLASKGEWHRLDEELRPLIKKTLYVPARASNEYVYGSAHAGTAGITLAAELSDICRVDGAFKLLSSTDPEVRERAREELDRVVSRRLRRPAETEDTEAYLSGDTEGDIRQTATQLQSVWTEARKASRRLSVAWELYDQGARITCGEATVSAGNRNKLIKILRAILNQGRDRSLQDKPSQGKAMACVAADPANSHFMRSGRYTRFKEWRFIHRARLNLLPPERHTHVGARS